MPYQCYHKICINSIYYIARSAGLQAVFDVNLLLLKGKVLEMEKQYKVGIVGATGMVGQRFVTLLENHPWFKLTVLAASGRSAGKTYEEAVGPRWAMTVPMPESVKKMVVLDASKVEEVASQVDFIFCAVNMPKDEIKALEEAYAKAECPVVSNNSANRFTPDVPMVVPEINPEHFEVIPFQKKRLGQLLPGGQHGRCCSGKEGKRSHASPSAFRGAQSRHAVGGGEQPAGSGREIRDESQSQPRRHAGHGTLIIGSVGQQGAQQDPAHGDIQDGQVS